MVFERGEGGFVVLIVMTVSVSEDIRRPAIIWAYTVAADVSRSPSVQTVIRIGEREGTGKLASRRIIGSCFFKVR